MAGPRARLRIIERDAVYYVSAEQAYQLSGWIAQRNISWNIEQIRKFLELEPVDYTKCYSTKTELGRRMLAQEIELYTTSLAEWKAKLIGKKVFK